MKNIIQKLSMISLISYTTLLTYWMILGFGRRHTNSDFRYNLKPFQTIKHFLHIDRFTTDVWVINLFGNIGAFLPFGILLPIIFGGKLKRSFLMFFMGLFILESLQLLSRRGSFDIDDFILNSIGFIIGYGIYKLLMIVNSRMGGIA
ncbi:VanZ family protein [Paenibacillus sp. CMAA1364]